MSTGTPLRLTYLVAIWALWVQMAGMAIASEKNCTAFTHASLIPMFTEIVIPDQTVVVEGKQIFDVGPSSQKSLGVMAAGRWYDRKAISEMSAIQ